MSDDNRRKKYDTYGEASFTNNSSSGFNDFSDISDIFEKFFGGFAGFSGFSSNYSRSANIPTKGEDIELYVDLEFFESINGTKKEIEVHVKSKCSDCGGTGAKSGTKKEVCKHCDGRGSVRIQRQSFFGTVVSEELCRECNGTGEIITEKCSKCKGKKYIIKRRKITIDVPSGVNTNNIMTLREQGNCGENGGPNGDIYVIFKVKKHELFVRDGNNINFELPISFVEATLGSEIEIPTLDGKEIFTIPEGTETGQVFKLRGRGVKDVNGYGKGDLIFSVKIITPKNLSEKQKNILREFASERDDMLKEHKKNFFDKVKELFD